MIWDTISRFFFIPQMTMWLCIGTALSIFHALTHLSSEQPSKITGKETKALRG